MRKIREVLRLKRKLFWMHAAGATALPIDPRGEDKKLLATAISLHLKGERCPVFHGARSPCSIERTGDPFAKRGTKVNGTAKE